MSCLLTMSMMSSVLFLLLAVTEAVRPEMFSRKYRYRMLKAVLALLLVPLPLFWDLVQKTLLHAGVYQKNVFVYTGTEPTILYAHGMAYKNTAYQVDIMIRSLCFGIGMLSFLYHLFQYFSARKQISHTFYSCPDQDLLDLLQIWKKKMKIRRKVYIYTSDFKISPFTIGVFKPIIVVPRLTEKSQLEMAVCHELCHIKAFDGAVKFLYKVLRDFYWYHPVVWLIGNELDQASELACDEQVTRYMDKAGRRKYGNLLIDIASEDFIYAHGCMDSFIEDKQTIEKRLRFIMKETRNTSVFAVFVSMVMAVCSAAAVIVYKPVSILKETPCEGETFGSLEAGMSVVIETGEDPAAFSQGAFEKIMYPYEFSDSDGNTYQADTVCGYKDCVHHYVYGICKEHVKKADGSCRLRADSAKRCFNCGYITDKVPLTESRYPVCIHE